MVLYKGNDAKETGKQKTAREYYASMHAAVQTNIIPYSCKTKQMHMTIYKQTQTFSTENALLMNFGIHTQESNSA